MSKGPSQISSQHSCQTNATPPQEHAADTGELPVNGLSQRLDAFVSAVGRLSSWLWLAVLVVVLTNVFSRFVLSAGSIALEELSWHLFGIAMMLTLGFAVVKDDHVRVDVLREKFSLRAQAIIELAGIVLLALPIIALMIDALVPYAYKAFIYNERSQAPSGLPYRFIFKSALPIGLLLVAMALFSRGLRCMTLLFAFPRAVLPTAKPGTNPSSQSK
ncbi:TRAP transporter small permease subunit [Oceanisphaera arctica]|nr:TRAP transporter small permease subunit [Oceanisphaera arctica]GHA10947.1 membrane protein [Oceanisphaera arctica]